MIPRLILLMVLVLPGRLALGETPEQLFQQGNQMYQQERLEEARAAYESIVAMGYGSGELFYNLGNTYYRSGEIALAILSAAYAARTMTRNRDSRDAETFYRAMVRTAPASAAREPACSRI